MFNEYTQSALNLATLLTALVSFFTLLEMRKQRIMAIQPDIVVSNLDALHLYYSPQMSLYASWPYYWSTKPLDDLTNLCDAHTGGAFNIKLKNVGAGIAKDVSLSWDFDVEFFVNEISKLDLDVELYFNGDYHSRMSLFREKGMAFFDGGSVSEKNVFYLSVGEEHEIPFFQVYTQLLSLWLYGKLYINDPLASKSPEVRKYVEDEFENLPTPSLSISYKDMAGNMYKKEYNYKLGFCLYGKKACTFNIEILS